ncbi:DUF1294 domain-containing protein [Paenibacillus harenae]|uniref:DUF1294 domain-containing protein n=1 Tax=Paenibacillus harenae TaxID=306543 RepID=UPI002792D2B2|nr:DUF1294 domain-containing protein [Paenibacillus harenae]MDQ0059793.1 uncharacterized membrane protein YsdA (DUF1294 family) [Paenibacillus harenae]
MDFIYIIVLYLLLINMYTFALMGRDKKLAVKQRRRVPEKRLFTLSAIGGSIGTWFGMRTWRHKTKHNSFVFGIPAIFVLQVAIVVVLYRLIG